MKRLPLLITLTILVGIALLAVPAASAQSVYDPNSVVFGRTYTEWSAAWWQWVYSIPSAQHPLFDTGDCSIGQSGPVWFLGGKFYSFTPSAPSTKASPATIIQRSCTIPYGKAIYFPVGNIADAAPEEPNWACGSMFPPLETGTVSEMLKCVETFLITPDQLEADIDGRPVPQLTRYYTTSVFSVTWPADNMPTATGEGPFAAGTYFPVAEAGYYLMLRPLSPGKHTLHFITGNLSFVYNLTITK